MFRTVLSLTLVLIEFVLVGSVMTLLAQAGQPTTAMTMTTIPNCTMTVSVDAKNQKPLIPCREMLPRCLKQLDCFADAALLLQNAGSTFAAHVLRIGYPPPWSKLSGIVVTPEPLPPRTI